MRQNNGTKEPFVLLLRVQFLQEYCCNNNSLRWFVAANQGQDVLPALCYSILLRVYDANKIKIWLTSKYFNVKFLEVLKRKTPQLVTVEFLDVFVL